MFLFSMIMNYMNQHLENRLGEAERDDVKIYICTEKAPEICLQWRRRSDPLSGPLTALTHSLTAACFYRAGVGTQTDLPPCCDSIRAARVSLQPSTALWPCSPTTPPASPLQTAQGGPPPIWVTCPGDPHGTMEGRDSFQWGQSIYIYIYIVIYIYTYLNI